MICDATGAVLRVIPINDGGELVLEEYEKLLRSGPVKMVAVNHVSNSLGTINPVETIIAMAHRGRLNVMAHVLGKPYEQILAEFKDPVTNAHTIEGVKWSGDVNDLALKALDAAVLHYHGDPRRLYLTGCGWAAPAAGASPPPIRSASPPSW